MVEAVSLLTGVGVAALTSRASTDPALKTDAIFMMPMEI
jgi:hypothetical protein